ncbi:MAG: hypothetical protein KME09_05945 [Pleurocapsa minor HA4230-MV1]|jgi:hypothetical protein|nr:hypothetical protein [Pleurocapsa minor HA4230-MV1]
MVIPYNVSFACLKCCKSFKREYQIVSKNYFDTLKCPNCGDNAHNFGRHFKAPKSTDKKQWEKIRFLFDNGFIFQKIRIGSSHHDIVTYPKTLKDAKNFVIKYKKYALNQPKKNL